MSRIVLRFALLALAALFSAPALAFDGNSVATAALMLGCLVFGWAADRFGAARALLVGVAGLAASTYALYLHLASGDTAHFMPLYAVAGAFTGVVGVVPAIMVAAFPPAVRFSGLSFSYNIAYAVFGGITPPLVGWLSARFGGLAPAHYVALASVVGAGVAVHLLRRPRSP